MSEIGERFRTVAAGFTARVAGVPEGAWSNPAPCEGWTALDVVRHLVEWVPAFFGEQYGVAYPEAPSVDHDPAGAWAAVRDRLQAALDDPATAELEVDGPMGRLSFEQAFAMIALSDVLIHTWDLARATGQDEALDPHEVAAMAAGLAHAPEEAMRASGHFGPRVEVGPEATDQDRLLAFMGRRP